ncbi:MAG: NDP-sugar pyrophosphorylase family protein, partial [Natrialbaceae archaeon]
MKAVILAAGEGNRLEPLTANRPKPMIPVANKPVLEYVVEAVADAGIQEIVLVVGYERSRIQSHFGDGDDWDVAIEYAVQEKQLGTGHAALQARPHVDEPFLVLNGDRIIDPTAIERVTTACEGSDVEAIATVTSVDI